MTSQKKLALNSEVASCRRCPRLIDHCKNIAKTKRKSYADQNYWGKPVPNFGDPRAEFLIVGLAPAAHGANRTGRMFTGDRSGDWLYRALHKAGFANQALSQDINDGLKLKNCLISAACHCAPPDNKPTSEELNNCRVWFDMTMDNVPAKVVLALGGIGWNTFLKYAKEKNWYSGARPKFSHGAKFVLENGLTLVGSYHPSQQNTFTGRLTEPMFDKVFEIANKVLKEI